MDLSSLEIMEYDEWYQTLKEALNSVHRKQMMWLANQAVRTHLFSDVFIV